MAESDKSINAELIMARLDDLKTSQENIVKEMTTNFKEINNTLADFKTTISDVKEIKSWKKEVTDVWSPPQMKEVKDEVYEHKNKWSKVVGIVIAAEIIIGFIITLVLKK